MHWFIYFNQIVYFQWRKNNQPRKQEVAQYLRCLVYILRFYKYHFQIFSMSEIWNGNRIFSILSQQRDMPRRDIINFETKRHCGLSTLNLKDFNSIAIRLVVHFPVIFVYLNNIVAVPAIWKSKKNWNCNKEQKTMPFGSWRNSEKSCTFAVKVFQNSR